MKVHGTSGSSCGGIKSPTDSGGGVYDSDGEDSNSSSSASAAGSIVAPMAPSSLDPPVVSHGAYSVHGPQPPPPPPPHPNLSEWYLCQNGAGVTSSASTDHSNHQHLNHHLSHHHHHHINPHHHINHHHLNPHHHVMHLNHHGGATAAY